MSEQEKQSAEQGSVKETLISLIISLAMALIVKTYIVEAYRIPTGSMAPTLLGDHAAYRGPRTGSSWTVDRGRPGAAAETRGLLDPATGATFADAPRVDPLALGAAPPGRRDSRAGDRILVQKYLYEVRDPRRFEVVVFRNPTGAQQNYIKRLVGLPNEHVWIVDGDLFTSPFLNTPNPADEGLAQGTWVCQRKSTRVQRSLWRTLFSSEMTPLDAGTGGTRWFVSPWEHGTDGWHIEDRRSYRYERPDPTTLWWDTADWPLTDWEPYNDRERSAVPVFSLADLRMRCAIDPDQPNLIVTATITARQHEFQAVMGDGRATVRMRLAAQGRNEAAWTVLADAPLAPFAPGRATPIEFWHSDQSLRVFVNDRQIVIANYNWSPAERLEYVTGRTLTELRLNTRGSVDLTTLGQPSTYVHAEASAQWSFSGGPFTAHRVGLDRDIFYQPALGGGSAGFGCHPDRVVTLGPDHFFMLGDNSADSLDGRGWEDYVGQHAYRRPVDPFVAQQIDPAPGVVHRKLMLGKAFFVYFPAPLPLRLFGGAFSIPVPDFGHMRLVD